MNSRSFGKSLSAPLARRIISDVHLFRFTRFHRLLRRAAHQQEKWVLNRVARCRDTTFGKDHAFHEIHTLADFRKRVPIVRYDSLQPYIDAVAAGDTGALIPASEKLLRFTITTGSSGVPKLNPITNTWLKQYRQVWDLWGLQMFADHRDHLGDDMLQMAGTWDMGTTPGGYSISMVSALLARAQNPVVRPFYAVPSDLNDISDPVARYYTAIRLCITRRIGWIILMNPGTLIRLAEIGNDNNERLIRDLRNGTLSDEFEVPPQIREILSQQISQKQIAAAQRLEQIVERTGRLDPKDYWDRPAIGCWIGGTAGFQMRYLPQYFGDAPLRDMGLVSSEGRHTIPLEDGKPEGVLAIPAGYYEFIPVDEAESTEPTVLGGHELTIDADYLIVMTTAAGLWRFNIGDVVRCRSFIGEAPVLEFVQKWDRCGDLEGEKLTEHQFLEMAHDAARGMGISIGNISAVPCREADGLPYYSMLIERGDVPEEQSARSLLREIDGKLKSVNFLYKARRKEGVLGEPRLIRLADGEWHRHMRDETIRRGTGDYQYKHPGLIQDAAVIGSLNVVDTVTYDSREGSSG